MNKTIKDISLEIGSGITPLRSNELYWNSPDIPWIKTEQLGQYKIFDSTEYISNFALEDTNIRLWSPRTVSVAMYGEGKTRGNASILMIETATNQACCNIKVNDALADYRFLYYWLKNNYENLRTLSAGVRKNLNADDIKNFPFPENSLPEQEKIADILSVVDDKIELNSKICSELEAMAKTLYDYWFVQFDFPDESGKPYRTAGGEMVWNEQLKQEIPKGWEVTNIGKITANFDSRRIPLSQNERNSMKGDIPYYGATGVMDYVDQFIFDGQYVLIAEDGSVMDDDGHPIVQMIWGKTWVNNHAHVLEGCNGYSNELLYFVLKDIPVIKIMTGSIQKKINQDNLNNYKIPQIPHEIANQFTSILKTIFSKLRAIEIENSELTKLRDWLLPMLMNGQAWVE